ncbi:MAG: metal ABC transporter permease [Pirellula sp.]|nr:metal ABC transporter permease [Pirellula sp.]
MFWDWNIDGWIIVAGALAAIASSLLGCLLMLRRMSLIGDAISHSVLPGIAAAVLVFQTNSNSWIFFAAALAGLFAVWLSSAIKKWGGVEESAAIGIVFTSLFSIGLVMVFRSDSFLDLDPACILFGSLETSILATSQTWVGVIPDIVASLAVVCVLNSIAIIALFKEWRITTFDPEFAKTQGISDAIFHYLLAALVSVTCIAAFEAVGTVLVVAMLIVPAATAYLLSRNLQIILVLAVVISILFAVFGHLSAITVPKLFGLKSLSSSSMMAVVGGLLFSFAILFGPQQGLVAQWLRTRKIGFQILQDDLLALLYRAAERNQTDSPNTPCSMLVSEMSALVERPVSILRKAIRQLENNSLIIATGESCQLTEAGSKAAQNLVRSHRLWEKFLANEMNVAENKVHPHAEKWEHVTNSNMRIELDALTGNASRDPHGRAIPPES